MNEFTPKEFDLEFVLRDCNGDIKAAQRRVDRALAEREKRGLLRAAEIVRGNRNSRADERWNSALFITDKDIRAEAEKVGK